MKVLITNNHVLNENVLNKEIMISFNNDNYSARINLANSRIKFTKKDLDVTIIELIKDDNMECNYLQIDASVYKEKIFLRDYYKKHPIYIIHYENGDIVYSSYGLLKGIIENTNEIHHLCCTGKGSSGSPILSLKSNMVIGLHKGASEYSKFNVGILMKDIISEFSKFLKNIYKKGSKLINTKNHNNYNYYINKDINNNDIKISNNQINNKNSNFFKIRMKFIYKNIDNINRKTNNNKYNTVDKNKNIIYNINNGKTNNIHSKGVNKNNQYYIDNKINNIESKNKILKIVKKIIIFLII